MRPGHSDAERERQERAAARQRREDRLLRHRGRVRSQRPHPLHQHRAGSKANRRSAHLRRRRRSVPRSGPPPPQRRRPSRDRESVRRRCHPGRSPGATTVQSPESYGQATQKCHTVDQPSPLLAGTHQLPLLSGTEGNCVGPAPTTWARTRQRHHRQHRSQPGAQGRPLGLSAGQSNDQKPYPPASESLRLWVKPAGTSRQPTNWLVAEGARYEAGATGLEPAVYPGFCVRNKLSQR
jgi:hypothetical protein